MVPTWCHDDKESIDEKIKTIDALFDELSTNVTSQSERIEPSEVGGGRAPPPLDSPHWLTLHYIRILISVPKTFRFIGLTLKPIYKYLL